MGKNLNRHELFILKSKVETSQYVPGLGKPPDSGIISGGAVARTFVSSRIKDGCLHKNEI